MIEHEKSMVDELKDLRARAYRENYEEFPDAEGYGWIGLYVRWITDRLQDEAKVGRLCAAEYKKDRTTRNKATVHTSRRRVALLHQEVELIIQGTDIPGIAADHGESIGGGCRYAFLLLSLGLKSYHCPSFFSVNKVVFRDLYEFWYVLSFLLLYTRNCIFH